jgi:crossover junction endodeoxyribonuclease RuvC
MRILGIDPGIRNTGWGIVEQSDNRLAHIANGVIKPDPALPDADRLHIIAVGLADVIAATSPDLAAIEEIFVAKSAASALKLGMARGVSLMQCAAAGLEIRELAARRVKKSITGTGTADKVQMQDMVERLLGIRAENADAADALAIAIAAGHEAAFDGARLASFGANKSGKNHESTLVSKGDGAPASGLHAAIEMALARDAGGDKK